MKIHTLNINLIKFAIALLTIKVMCSFSVIIPWNSFFDNICVLFAIIIAIYKLSSDSFTLKQFIIFGILSVLVLYTCVKIKQYELLISLLTIFLLKDENIDEYIHLIFLIELSFFALHIIISACASLTSLYDHFWIYTGSRLRFNGGFSHPNVLSSFILSCLLMYVWEHFHKFKQTDYLLIAFVALVTYGMTKSRTGLILNILLIMLIYFTKHSLFFRKHILKKLGMILFPLCSIVIFYACSIFLKNNFIITALDNLLSGRIRYGAYALSHSGITLLPRYLDYVRMGFVPWDNIWRIHSFTFDNLYSYILVVVGWIWLIIITIIIVKFVKKTDYRCSIFVIIWTLFSLTEVHGLNCYIFFPILLLTILFQKDEEKNYE